MFFAYVVIDVIPPQPFHILTSNFSANAMHLRKHMVVAYDTEPPTSITTASSDLHCQPPTKTPKRLDCSASRDDRSANGEVEQNAALLEALLERHDNVHNLVKAVNYKPRTDRKPQIDEHTRQKQGPIARLKKICSKAVAIFEQYHAYKKLFIDMLSQF